jgi:hypothetical protein
MTEDEREAFIETLKGTCSLYQQDITEFLVRAWWAVLKPYDLNAIKRALALHFANADAGRFMPKPADVVRVLGGTAQDNAMLAYTLVVKSIASVGGYVSVVFDDPNTHVAIEGMGGWAHLCAIHTEKEGPFIQREFEARYRASHNRGAAEWPRVLRGLISLHNGERWFAHTPPPRLLGNVAQAKFVYENGVEPQQLTTNVVPLSIAHYAPVVENPPPSAA